MSAAPTFAGIPHVEGVQVSAANTNRDGTGTLVTCFTAGASGSRIERIRIKAPATTTANMIRFYISDGTNVRLLRETSTIALTPSQTVQAYESYETFGLVIPSGWLIKASVHAAEAYNLITEGADL